MTTDAIGIVGLGRMGSAMAHALLAAGRGVVGYDVNADAGADVVDAGGERSADVAGVVRRCSIVITSLVTAQQLASVLDEIGEAAGDGPGPLVVDASTLTPHASLQAAERFEGNAGRLLRAPVSGSTVLAAQGKLVVLCSGTREAFDEAAAVLGILASKVEYVGEREMARAAKLAVNLVVIGTMELVGEAVGLGEALGLHRADVMRLINESVIGSAFTAYKEAAVVQRDYTPTASVSLILKDLALMLSAGEDLGLDLPVTSLVQRQYAAVEDAGAGECDMAAVIGLTERPGRGLVVSGSGRSTRALTGDPEAR